jgi:hypothetical protein
MPSRLSANAVIAAVSPLAAFSVRARATGRNDGDGQDGAGGAIRCPAKRLFSIYS